MNATMTENDDRFYSGLLVTESAKSRRIPTLGTSLSVIPSSSAALQAATQVRRYLRTMGTRPAPTPGQLDAIIAAFLGALAEADVNPRAVLAAGFSDLALMRLGEWAHSLGLIDAA